jgi:hypothetical protein
MWSVVQLVQTGEGPLSISGLAASGNYLYFTDATGGNVGSIQFTPSLMMASSPSNQPSPLAIATDGKYVFWANNVENGSVVRGPVEQ